MAWLDDRIWCHPKVTDVSDRAFRVYVNGLAYSSGFSCRGHLTIGQQKAIGATSRITFELVSAGLWDEEEDTIYIHDWEEHNGKRDARKEADRERKRLERSAGQSAGQESGQSTGTSEGRRTGLSALGPRVRARGRPPDDGVTGEKNPSGSDSSVSETQNVEGPTLSSEIRRIYDHWRERRNKTRLNYTTCSPARRKKIQARLREFTADELCTAIDHVARDPWPDRSQHDDLTVIFRSREQVERFLEMPPTANGNTHLSDYDRAKAWVIATGWRFDDADLLDQLGRFGVEGPAKQPLFDLAVKLKEDDHATAVQ